MKTFRPFIVIAIAFGLLYFYAKPQWNAIAALRIHELELQTALGKAQELTVIRNNLMQQYNVISPENTAKIARVVPQKYDPVKLVADISAIGLQYGMMIRDIKFSNVTEIDTTGAIQGATPAEPYIKRQLSFSTVVQYKSFIAFITDLEQSLQLMDLQKVEVMPITSGPATKVGGVSQGGALNFKVDLHTYWIE